MSETAPPLLLPFIRHCFSTDWSLLYLNYVEEKPSSRDTRFGLVLSIL
jgi:hypothetical protein